MNKLKQCANNRFCRVRSFVQIAALVLIVAVIVIYLWNEGILTS